MVNRNLIPDSNSVQTMFRLPYVYDDFSNYIFKYVNKTPHFANNLNFGHNKHLLHSESYSCLESRSTFTRFRDDI